jgi:translation initiation factor IF-3
MNYDKSGWILPALIFILWRCVPIKELMINEQIRDRELRVIGQDGEQLGIMSRDKAMALAEQQELDLALIAPTGKPPVAKLMDYGKYRFEAAKQEREARKNQKVVDLKEVRLSATIEEHDMNVKAKNAIKFLKGGDKVKVSIRFRGRQLSHTEVGLTVMKAFLEIVKDVATVERQPRVEGRQMIMILAPIKD